MVAPLEGAGRGQEEDAGAAVERIEKEAIDCQDMPSPPAQAATKPEPKAETESVWGDAADEAGDTPGSAEQSASMWGDIGDEAEEDEHEERPERESPGDIEDAWDQLEALDPNESDQSTRGDADTLMAPPEKQQVDKGDTWMKLPPLVIPVPKATAPPEDAALAATAASQRTLGPDDIAETDGEEGDDPALAPTYEQAALSQAEAEEIIARAKDGGPAAEAKSDPASLWGDEAEEDAQEEENTAAETSFAQPILSKDELTRLIAEKSSEEAQEEPSSEARPEGIPKNQDDPLSGLPRAPEGGLLIAPSKQS